MTVGIGGGRRRAPACSACSAWRASSAFITFSMSRLRRSGRRQGLQMFVQVRLDLALGLDHEAQVPAIAAQPGQGADRGSCRRTTAD